jgi:hypothetical protein
LCEVTPVDHQAYKGCHEKAPKRCDNGESSHTSAPKKK